MAGRHRRPRPSTSFVVPLVAAFVLFIGMVCWLLLSDTGQPPGLPDPTRPSPTRTYTPNGTDPVTLTPAPPGTGDPPPVTERLGWGAFVPHPVGQNGPTWEQVGPFVFRLLPALE